MLEHENNSTLDTEVTLETIPGIPLVKEGDNLGKVLLDSMTEAGISLQDKDILIIAQKIVSKAEGRLANLNQYPPTTQAVEISQRSGRDPRLAQLIINESLDIRWVMEGTPDSPGIIVGKHRLGHVCSGAGIDATNIGSANQDQVLLLPIDPDSSAKTIADYFDEVGRVKIGVVIIDTLGDRYRFGSIGKAIGVANVPSRLIERNLTDLDGKQELMSDLAFADSMAGLAMILMGQPDKKSPVVLIRGVDYPFTPNAKIRDVFYNGK